MRSAFHPHAQQTAFRRRDASAIQNVRPLESIAETRPQPQSALGIVDHLRRRFARFELVTYVLKPYGVAYQMSVTLPVRIAAAPLWTRIVSALFTSMSTWWAKSMYTMWVPTALLNP